MIVAQSEGRPFIDWGWITAHLGDIAEKLREHIYLTVLALVIGFVIAFALSIVALRWRKTYAPVTWVTGVLYTIPSIALFAFFVTVTGFSTVTALIGLVSYTLLILIRNIVAGIDGVDPAVRESALGMGYTRRRLFLQIELPLAVPVILAGVRIAAVTTIGLVTVTALIGQGGLGFFILRGLQRFFDTEIFVGVVLSVALAVGVDAALVGLEKLLTPWARKKATL